MTSDGKPFGQERFKEIVRERYTISKKTNISYKDTAQITPLEREYLLKFIMEDLQKEQELIDKMKQETSRR